jgi:hypothetical protein
VFGKGDSVDGGKGNDYLSLDLAEDLREAKEMMF